MNSGDKPQPFTVADWFHLATFAAMSFTYAIYMAGSLPQSVYFVSLFCCAVFGIFRLVIRVLRSPVNRIYFGGSFAGLAAISIAFVTYTAIREHVALATVTATSINEALYIIIPATIALTAVNTPNWRFLDACFTILLLRYLLYFFLEFTFDISSLLAIDWRDSNSSNFETSFAHDLLVLTAYFLYRNQRIRASISLGLTLISFKRAAFIIAPLLALFRKKIVAAPRPRKITLITLGVASSISPLVIVWVYSEPFARRFASLTGVDLDTFVSGRVAIYQLATTQVSNNLGFGWVNLLLSDLAYRSFGTTWNGLLHNDTLRLYLEVGALGLIAYSFMLAYLGRWSRMSLILVGYTMFVLVTSRLITHMSFWIVLFLALAAIERFTREQRALRAAPPSADHHGLGESGLNQKSTESSSQRTSSRSRRSMGPR